MNVPMANLVAQHQALKAELTQAFEEVMATGQFVQGEQVAALEPEIAALCGSKYAVACNSGTDALLLSLRALEIGPGDEVITAPFTFGATAETIRLAGATPVFADIDAQTLNIDPVSVEDKITPRTKAIMPIHLFGQIADMTSLTKISQQHSLPLIGDAAQAIGSTQLDKPIGAWTDLTTLSFYPTKNLGACGDAGMILTDNEDWANHMRRLRNHGSSRYAYYDEIGYNSRMDGLQAAFLRVKARYLHSWNETRRMHAALYEERLAGLHDHISLPVTAAGNWHIYHQYTLRVADSRRDDLQKHLAERGVASAIYYPLSLHLQQAYADLGYCEGDLPVSEQATREVLSIPVHPEMRTGQVEYVAETIGTFFA